MKNKRRVIDWDKVSGSVLIFTDQKDGLYPMNSGYKPRSIWPEWQAHTGLYGCPVDPHACFVETNDGQKGYGEDIIWGTVFTYRVTRCNYE